MAASAPAVRRCAPLPTHTGCGEPAGTGLSISRTNRRISPMRSKKHLTSPEAAVPTSITIRMYNVGFGDCFLLTFQSPDKDRHVLIDYGSTAAPKSGGANYMTEIAEDIKTACNGKLDMLVATHRHRDHISGFATDGDGTGKIIASLKPDHVIQPWTEDPAADPHAMTATTMTGAVN